MQSSRKCEVGRLPDGTVTVDGTAYPMAGAVVATEDAIQASIRAMAQRIAAAYKHQEHRDSRVPRATSGATPEAPISYDNPLVIISVLKGSYIFTADFVRYLHDAGLPNVCDFIRLTSYNSGTTSSGSIQINALPKYQNLDGKHVLVLEDVCDSGRTLVFLKRYLLEKYHPKSVRFCVMVNKHADARKVRFQPEYSCMDAPNKYIIGYGFEVNDRYRDFRHIFILKDGEARRYPAKL